jgi:hypothetical protein
MAHTRVLTIVVTAGIAISCSSAVRRQAGLSQGSLCFVTAEELHGYGSSSLYDALTSVRPSLMRRNLRGEMPIVIVDGTVTSDPVAALQGLTVEETAAVRRLSASDAAQRYGLHQSRAVLEVVTARPSSTEVDPKAASCS